jgi:MFS family permease
VHLIVLPMLLGALLSPDLRRNDRPPPAPAGAPAFALRPILPVGVVALLAGSITFSIPVFTPFHLRDIGVAGATAAGSMISLVVLCSVATSFAYGELRRWLSPTAVFVLTFALWAGGLALVATATAFPQVAAGMVIAGIGGGLIGPNIFSVAATAGPDAARGRNVGIVKGIYYAGPFIGPSVLQLVQQHYRAGGALLALVGLAALLAVICLASLGWHRLSARPA